MAKAGPDADKQLLDDMGLKEELKLQMKKRLELEEKNDGLEKRVAELEAKLAKLLGEPKPKKPRAKMTDDEKKQAQLISSKLAYAREALMAGKITAATLETLRTYSDTLRRQDALVQAYMGYCRHHKAESWEDIPYEEVLEELQEVVDEEQAAKAAAKK